MPEPAPSKLRNEPIGWVLVAFAAMLWGSDVLLRPKALASGMSSVSVVMFEHLALTVLFAPILFRTRAEWLKLDRKQIIGLIIISWGGSGLATVLLTQAYSMGDPVTAALLQKLQPLFAISLAGPILRERLKGIFFACLFSAMIGAYLMSFGLTWLSDPVSRNAVVPAALAIGAAAAWGACTVVGRWSLASIDPYTVAGLRFVIALPLLVVWNLALPGGFATKFTMTSAAFLPLLAIVLIPDALGMALYYVGLRRTTASLATLAELAYPATAVLLAYPLARAFTPWKWFGVILLILSLYVVRLGNLVRDPVTPDLA